MEENIVIFLFFLLLLSFTLLIITHRRMTREFDNLIQIKMKELE